VWLCLLIDAKKGTEYAFFGPREAFVGKIAASTRPLLAFLLSLFLLMPTYAVPVTALGTIVYADHANVGNASASVGSTIFGGDRLVTAQGGSVQVRTGAARFLLAQSSSAILLQEDASAAAILTSGSATFSTARSNAFALHVFSALVRPNSDDPTIGQVTVLGRNEMLVKSTKGALACTVDGETRVVAEGESYRVVIADAMAGAQGPAGGGSGRPPLRAGKSKAIYYIAAGVAAVTIFAISEALESPDRP
jgi:hypothetical protein